MFVGRTALITGGTSGLGYQAAKAIARSGSGWTVAITGRDEQRAAARARRLSGETGGAPTAGLGLELASLASVRGFADGLAERELPPLGAVVCNAGIQIVTGMTHTDDGFETTFAVNHLGHYLLINLLLDRLAEPARIVIVASDTHDPDRRTGMPDPDLTDARQLANPVEQPDETAVDGRRRYTTSKLCNVITAYALARRLSAPSGNGGARRITVNAFDPGLMPGSGLARDSGPVQRFAWRFLMPALTLLPINAHTPRASGAALARLVTDPELEGVTGEYFEGKRIARSSKDS
ncbi:MAG: SDR family NAD(P)-dependent oxidoreductase [Solirubrobacterales bacterium]